MDAELKYQAAMQQCDYLAGELLSERRKTEARVADLAADRDRERGRAEVLEHRLQFAVETIANMERSRFWKLRQTWARLTGSR